MLNYFKGRENTPAADETLASAVFCSPDFLKGRETFFLK
jgi:hypothetical protein